MSTLKTLVGLCLLLFLWDGGTARGSRVEFQESVYLYVMTDQEGGAAIWDVEEGELFQIWEAGGIAYFNDRYNKGLWSGLVADFGIEMLHQALTYVAGKLCGDRCRLAMNGLSAFKSVSTRNDRKRRDIRHRPHEGQREGGAFTYFRPRKSLGLGAAKDTIWMYEHLDIAFAKDYYFPRERGVIYLAPNDKPLRFLDNTGFYWIRLDVFRIVPEKDAKVQYRELPEDN